MKDLFISRRVRGGGLGRQFMVHIASLALSMGCRRFDWTAETDNARALAFYDDLGASRIDEKVYFRFDDAGLEAFVLGSPVD